MSAPMREDVTQAALRDALAKAAQIAGDAMWSLPMPKHWDRDKQEYSEWCAKQTNFVREQITGLVRTARPVVGNMLKSSAQKHATICSDLADKTPVCGEPDDLWWQRQSALREAGVLLGYLSLSARPDAGEVRLAYKTGHAEGYIDATDDGTGNGYCDHDAAEEGWQQYKEKLGAEAVHTNPAIPADVSDDLTALAAMREGVDRGMVERYRHVKRGTVYEMVGTAELQAEQPQCEHAELAIYRGDDGKLWARNTAEFHDGRFAALSRKDPE